MSRPDQLDHEIDRHLTRAIAGREDGFTGLYECLAGRVAGYARSRGVDDVDDVVNEIFLAAFGGLDSGSDWDASRFRSWLFAIAWNKTVDWHRSAARQVDTTDHEPATLPVAGGHVEDDALVRMSRDQVDELLDHLTDDQRDVLVLRVVADLSLDETAIALDKPVGAVKALQHRALNALRRRVGAGEVSAEDPDEPVSPSRPPTTTEAR